MSSDQFRKYGVFVLEGLCDADSCTRIRMAMDSGRATSAEIYTDRFVVDPDVRRTLEVDVDPAVLADVQRVIDSVRDRAGSAFGVDLTATEGVSFLRYLPGGFYRAHRDRIEDDGDDWPRRVSVIMFLTTAGPGAGMCEGGALRLYAPVDGIEGIMPLDIPPVAGTLIAFPSTVLHEVLPVAAGIRDTVVDWFY